MKNKINLITLITFLISFFWYGCQEVAVSPNLTSFEIPPQLSMPSLTSSFQEPREFDLFAGQDILVGKVIISNDADNLYVKYEITDEDWCLEETHLAVATSIGEIPQTKNGNPIPGQFEYSDTDLGCLGVYEYTVPLADIGADCDDLLKIAAHAVVSKDGCFETVWQIGDVEEIVKYPAGIPNAGKELYTNYADEFNWGFLGEGYSSATPFAAGNGLAVVEPNFTSPFIVGTTPTKDFPYNSNSVRGYATNFDVQWTGALPYGGKLVISWSPGISADETKIITYSESGNGTFSAKGVTETGKNWFLDKYKLVQNELLLDPLSQGEHTINFKHTQGDGTFWDWIRLEEPCTETAWGAGTRFTEQGNWATYFEYTVTGSGVPSSDKITIEDSSQGKLKNGNPVAANRSVPESIKTDDDVDLNNATNAGFFSLGFGGSIEFSFPCAVRDGDGDDLVVIETTSGSYPLEQADVFAWSDGSWVKVGTVNNSSGSGLDRPGAIDLNGSGVTEATAFKIVDTTDKSIHNGNADGYDVQYVKALNGACCE